MTLGDSLWFPNSVRRAGPLVVIVLMAILHQSELLGLMNAGLLFGWLPAQLTYDILFLFVSVVVLYGIALSMPAAPPEYELSNQTNESAMTKSSSETEE